MWERTQDQSRLYQAILPKLMAGQSPKEIGDEFGLDPALVRVWKSRAIQKTKKAKKERQLVTIAESNVTGCNSEGIEMRQLACYAQQDDFSAHQDGCNAQQEGKKINLEAMLHDLHDAWCFAVKQIKGKLAEDVTPEIINCLKVSSEKLADIHCIRHGHIDPNIQPQQHLHLHQHNKGTKAKAITTSCVDAEIVVGNTDVSNQPTLLSKVDE